MRTLSEQLGFNRSLLFRVDRTIGYPLTSKRESEIERIALDKLENYYWKDAVIFNTINKITQIIMRAGYRFVGEKESVEFMEKFVEQIGYRGGELTWEELLERTFKYQCIYGNSWWELIYNKGGNIVDIDSIDPVRMDYAKDGMQIALDDQLKPLGYVYTLPFGREVKRRIEPPEGVSLMGNQVFLPPEKVAHFKLYTVGDGFYGIGLIEPIYNTTVRKEDAEAGFANSAHRTGFPLFLFKGGNEMHEPREDRIQNAVNELQKVSSLNAFGMPYYDDLRILEAKGTRFLRTFLDYFIDQQVAGMGMPKAFATGSGEATNRATLARQEYILKLSLLTLIKRTLSTIHSKVFYKICSAEGLKPPKLLWGEVALEELDAKADRITKYVREGIIIPDKNIEELVREIEELPPKSEKDEYKSPRERSKRPNNDKKREI